MIDHDQQASAHNTDIPYDILKQAAMLLVKAREAEQRKSPREAERLRSDARHMLGLQPQPVLNEAVFRLTASGARPRAAHRFARRSPPPSDTDPDRGCRGLCAGTA